MINKNLFSDDSNVRREAVESYFYDTLDKESLEVLAKLMKDPDKGVRNSLNILFSTLDNINIPKYIIKYVSSNNISVRNLTGNILLKIGNGAVDELVAYLDKSSDDEKKFCIDILGLIGNIKAESKIIETISSNEDENVILSCLEAFGNLKSEASVDILKEYFTKNEIYKPTVIESLGKIGNAQVLAFLNSIYYFQDELTKYSIVESLGLVGDPLSLKLLMSELKSDNEAFIGPLLLSVCQIKERYSLDILLDDDVEKNIISSIDSMEQKYLKSTFSLLSNSINDELISIFVKVFGKDYETDEVINPLLKENFILSIRAINDYLRFEPENSNELLTFVKDNISFDKELASTIISDSVYETFGEILLNLSGHDSEEIRGNVQELLFMLYPQKILEYGDSFIEDDCVWNRLSFVELLAASEIDDVQLFLEKLSSDTEEMVRERALSVLNSQKTG